MGYTFTIPLLIVNFIVYVPGALAFVLASRRPVAGAVATTVAGPLIAIAFLKLHLLGAWVPVWGPWNEPFTVLGVDTLSWAILWITAATVFTTYLSFTPAYTITYGTLAGVMITLMFFYITGLTIIYGAELNASLDDRVRSENARMAAGQRLGIPWR